MTILTGAFTVAMLLTACAEDPLSNLDGEPAAVIPDVSLAVLNLEQDRAITASVVDGRLTPMAIPVSFTACDSDIDLAMDEDYDPVPATSTRAIITAQVLDVSCVVVTGAGFTDTVEVVNLPAEWETASLSATTLAGGDTLTVFATPLLKFNADSAGVTFTGGSEGVLIAFSPEQFSVLVPFQSTGLMTIKGIQPTYAPGFIVRRPAADVFNQTGDLWDGDDAIATAPTLPLPGPGDTTLVLTNATAVDNAATCPEVALGFGSTGPCMIYHFSLSAPTALTFNVDWSGDADMDIYVCPDADPGNCFEDGGGGATANHPEETTATFTAGDHYLFIEIFAGAKPQNVFITISQPPAP